MIKFSDAKMKEIPKLLKSMSDALKVLNSDFEALKKIMDESKEPYVAREPKKRRSLPHTKDPNDISKRSYKRITVADLRRLVKIAHEDREDFFGKHPRWRKLYSDRVICIALCQGAALQYLYGKTGVKDFDVWTFYSEHPSAPFP